MDNPPPPEDVPVSQGPNLLWTPLIEREVEAWRQTGVFPFPLIALRSTRQFQTLSRIDLRLIHHLASVYQDMQPADMASCTVWVQELPWYVLVFQSRAAERH